MYHPLLHQEANRIVMERRRHADLLRLEEQNGGESSNLFHGLRTRAQAFLRSFFDQAGQGRQSSESVPSDC